MEILINTMVFLILGYASYYILSKLFAYQEGMTPGAPSGEMKTGIKAKEFAAKLAKEASVKRDAFIIGTYRGDYENVVDYMAEFVEALMLETTLQIDTSDPMPGIEKLVKLNQAKVALNSVLAYVDKK